MKKLVALVVGMVLGTALLVALPDATFELEGNIAVDSAPSDDWANTVPVKGADSSALASTFVADGSGNATIFTTGGSKDVNDVSQWQWKDQLGGLPDKDNITNAYAAAYANGDQLTFYFGADRFAQDGDAQFGFWFFKNEIQLGPGGQFVGSDGVTVASHAIGDVLVLVNLTNGGAVATAAAFRWVGGANPLFPIAVELDDAKCGENTDPDLCVISNETALTAPWAYAPKQGTPGIIPQFGFIEGGVNISILGGAAAGCFSSFLAETRSSQSPNATLKDFALGNFNTCKLDLAKTCDTVTFNETTGQLDYTSHVTVTNSGFGPVFDVTVTDTPSTLPASTFTLATLAAGASHTFDHTFSLTPGLDTPNPPSNVATVEAATAAGGAKVVTAGPVQAACPSVQFDANLTVTKTCAARVEPLNGTVVVVIDLAGTVCNVPSPLPAVPSPIDGVSVTDTPPMTPTPISLGSLAPGECKTYSAKYYPTAVSGTGTPGTQSYEDTIAVTGTARFNGTAKANTATANCPLCPPIH